MDIEQILSQLQRNNGHFAKNAVLEAVAHRAEITPALLEVLHDVRRNPERYASDPDLFIHIYAMYLLGQFRVAAAYPILVEIFSLPDERAFDIVGDLVTDGLSSILASVSNGDIGGITTLIENEQVNPYVRSAAMGSLLTLVACDERTREEVDGYFHRLFQILQRTPGDVWAWLACSCLDLWPDARMMQQLRTAWDEDLIDPDIVHWADMERAHARGQLKCMDALKRRKQLVTDVASALGGWACFDKDRDAERLRRAALSVSLPEHSLKKPKLTHPLTSKIGRNDPCPCASGKKFKKCCGR